MCKKSIAEAILNGEDGARWKEVEGKPGEFCPRNLTCVDVRALLNKTSGEALGLGGRLCNGPRITLDCWTQKFQKMAFPSNSRFADYLKQLMVRLGVMTDESAPKHFDEATDVGELGVIGKKRETVLKRIFIIFTVGQLAGLVPEQVLQYQERVRLEKIPGKINFERAVEKARTQISTGLPDYEDAVAETSGEAGDTEPVEIWEDFEFQAEAGA